MKDIKEQLLDILAAVPKSILPLKISNPQVGEDDNNIYGLLVRSGTNPVKHHLWDLYNGPEANPRMLVVASLPPRAIAGIVRDCLDTEKRRLMETYGHAGESGDIADWARDAYAYLTLEEAMTQAMKDLRTQQ